MTWQFLIYTSSLSFLLCLLSRASSGLCVEIDGQDTVDCQLLDGALDGSVGRALVVVVPHVVHVGELGLGDEGVALGARVLLGRTDGHAKDVGLAVLVRVSVRYSVNRGVRGEGQLSVVGE